jgi:hypothetical protein
MRRRADQHQKAVETNLHKRRDADIERAKAIFANFRRNLTDSLQALRQQQAERDGWLFDPDPAQLGQFRRDMQAMEDRLENLSGEESRELAAIRERYTDVKPFVSAVAVVFALTPQEA